MCRVMGNLDDPRGFDRNLSLSAGNVGCAYWSSFVYYVLVRPANHEHDSFARMILSMQYFTKGMLFWYSYDVCIKSSRRMKSGSCAPDMVSRPVVPTGTSSHALELIPTPQAMHNRNPKMPQQAYNVDASRMSPPLQGTRPRPPEESRSPPL